MAKYQLPVASKDTLGGVKIGDHITVENDGTINVDLNSTREEIQNSVDAVLRFNDKPCSCSEIPK